MSELQAAFQARRLRASQSAGVGGNGNDTTSGVGVGAPAGGDDSVNAVVPGDSSAATNTTISGSSRGTPTPSFYAAHQTGANQRTPPRTKSWDIEENINTEGGDGGIEVSPSPKGREALQLGIGTTSRAPPSMPYGSKVSQDPNTTTAGGGGGNDTAQDPRQGRLLSSTNKFGVRHSNPPADLSPYEPSDEEETDEAETKEPQNELQKKLRERRRKTAPIKVDTTTKNDGGDGSVGEGVKSPVVAMKWNSVTMAYEPVLTPKGGDMQKLTPKQKEESMPVTAKPAVKLADRQPGGGVAAAERKSANVVGNVKNTAVSSSTSNVTKPPTRPQPQQQPVTKTPTRTSTFFKRTAPTANSNTVVFGNQQQTQRQTGQQQQQQMNQQPTQQQPHQFGVRVGSQQSNTQIKMYNRPEEAKTEDEDESLSQQQSGQGQQQQQQQQHQQQQPSQQQHQSNLTPAGNKFHQTSFKYNQPMPGSRKYGGGTVAPAKKAYGGSQPISSGWQQRQKSNERDAKDVENEEEDAQSQQSKQSSNVQQLSSGQPDEVPPNPSTTSTATTAHQTGGGSSRPQQQIGGRPQQIGGRVSESQFGRTVGGRAASRGRGREDDTTNMEGRPAGGSMLGLMTKRYKEVQDEAITMPQDTTEQATVGTAKVEHKEGESRMEQITKSYKQRSSSQPEEKDTEGAQEQPPPSRPQSNKYVRPGMRGTYIGGGGTGTGTGTGGGGGNNSLNRWLQNTNPSSTTIATTNTKTAGPLVPPGSPMSASNDAGDASTAAASAGTSVPPASPGGYSNVSGTNSNVWSNVGSNVGSATAAGLRYGGNGGAKASNAGSAAAGSNTGSNAGSNTGSDVPEFMRMRLRATPNKRKSAGRPGEVGGVGGSGSGSGGIGPEKRGPVVAVAPKIAPVTSTDVDDADIMETDVNVEEEADIVDVENMPEEEQVAWSEETPPRSKEYDDEEDKQSRSWQRPQLQQHQQQPSVATGSRGSVRGRWQPPSSGSGGINSTAKSADRIKDDTAEENNSEQEQEEQPPPAAKPGNVRGRWQPPTSSVGTAESNVQDGLQVATATKPVVDNYYAYSSNSNHKNKSIRIDENNFGRASSSLTNNNTTNAGKNNTVKIEANKFGRTNYYQQQETEEQSEQQPPPSPRVVANSRFYEAAARAQRSSAHQPPISPGGSSAHSSSLSPRIMNSRFHEAAARSMGSTGQQQPPSPGALSPKVANNRFHQAANRAQQQQQKNQKPPSPRIASNRFHVAPRATAQSTTTGQQHQQQPPPSPRVVANSRFHEAAARAMSSGQQPPSPMNVNKDRVGSAARRQQTAPSYGAARSWDREDKKMDVIQRGGSWGGGNATSYGAGPILRPRGLDPDPPAPPSDPDGVVVHDDHNLEENHHHHHHHEQQQYYEHEEEEDEEMQHRYEQEEEETQQEQSEESPRYISNYDTAVMAAKNAIDLSNSNRSRSRHRHRGASSGGGPYSPSDHSERSATSNFEREEHDGEEEEYANRDPSLVMMQSSPEPSPSSSLVENDDDDEAMIESVKNLGGEPEFGGNVREDRLAGLARLAEQYDDLRTPRNNAASVDSTPRAVAPDGAGNFFQSGGTLDGVSPDGARLTAVEANSANYGARSASGFILPSSSQSPPNERQPTDEIYSDAFGSDAFANSTYFGESRSSPPNERQPTDDMHSNAALSNDRTASGFIPLSSSRSPPNERQPTDEIYSDAFGADPFDPFSTGVFSYQHHDSSTGSYDIEAANQKTRVVGEGGKGQNERHLEGSGEGLSTVRDSELFEAIFGETPGSADNDIDDLQVDARNVLPLTPRTDHDEYDNTAYGHETSPAAQLTPGQDSMGELSRISQQSSSYESASGVPGVEAIGLQEAESSSDEEDVIGDDDAEEESEDNEEEDESSEVEFTVDVANFADGSVGASMDDVDVLPQQHRKVHNVMSPKQKHVHASEQGQSIEGSSVASFNVHPLEVSLAAQRDVSRIAEPIQNPLSDNLIACRVNHIGSFTIEEIDVSIGNIQEMPRTVVSASISMDEVKSKMSKSSSIPDGVKVVGISRVLSLAAGVHRVQGRERIRVAALVEFCVVGYITKNNVAKTAKNKSVNKSSNIGGISLMRMVLVYRWGYNPAGTSLATMQSVLSMDSIDGRDGRGGYDPSTLQVADGLLFLGGSVRGHSVDSNTPTLNAAVFIAKPAVRDSWTSVPIGDTTAERVTSLAVKNDLIANDSVHYSSNGMRSSFLAVGLSDGSVVVVSYDLAARTNRLAQQKEANSLASAQRLLRPLCILRGNLDVCDLTDEDCLWPHERFCSTVHRSDESKSFNTVYGQDEEEHHCMSLAWIPNDSSLGASSLPLLAASFESGVAVYHITTASSPQQNAVIPGPVTIFPLASTKFITEGEQSEVDAINGRKPSTKIGWYGLGPRHPPCLSLLLKHEKSMYQRAHGEGNSDDGRGTMEMLSKTSITRLCLLAIDIPWYGSVEMDGNRMEGLSGAMRVRARAMGVICQRDLSADDTGSDACVNIVTSSETGGVISYSSSSGKLLLCKPIASIGGTFHHQVTNQAMPADGYFSSLSRPRASASTGLNSEGSIYFGTGGKSSSGVRSTAEEEDYRDVILTVYSVTVCGSSDEYNHTLGTPSQRHWLMISSPGDSPNPILNPDMRSQAHNSLPDPPTESNVHGDEVEKAGATTDILFELTCGENPISGLIPQSVVKEPCIGGVGGRRAAVVFSSGFFGSNLNANGNDESSRVRTLTKLASDPVAYTVLEISDGIKNRGASSFRLRHGRDVAFLPASQNDDFYCSSLLVLDSDGRALSITTVISSKSLPEGENERIVESVEKCSLQYEGIIGRRVFALLNISIEDKSRAGGRSSPPEILIAGYSTVVQRPCLLLSKHRLERADTGISNQLTLVEDVGLGHRLWLRPAEEILSIIELPVYDNMADGARANIAVASQERVMILSMEYDAPLSIIAEIDVHLTCASLSPLGSHCVAFSATLSGGHSSLMYLSCLDGVGSQGVIATLPASPSHHGRAHGTLLAAIRPDRCVYFTSHSGLRIASADEEDEDEHIFVTPLPHTRALLLLEPLVANALCQDKCRGKNAGTDSSVQRALHTIIEKFGRKDTSFPHSDGQGIGTYGAGITSQVHDMLTHYKCNEAALVLMTGSLPGDVLMSQPKLVAPWVPMESKLSAIRAPGADERGGTTELMMQLLSSGDTELSEFLRSHSADQNCLLSGALPGPLDTFSIMAEELAFDKLQKQGSSSVIDAIKLLDLAGRPSSESLLCQLALSLGTSPSTKKTLSDSEKLLREIRSSEDNNGRSADMVNMYANFCTDISLRMVHQRDGATLQEKEKYGPSLSQLAPSVQSVWDSDRVRSSIISSNIIETAVASPKSSSRYSTDNADPAWKQLINNNRHVWSSGPYGKKERLLELDGFEDWLGRCRPTILGKEGVAVAADTGERTLAEILSAAAHDENVGDRASNADSEENTSINDDGRGKNWVEGVGEARNDDDNLSLYLRFSEGDDEDGHWKADGFQDLTKNGHSARLYGSDLASMEATTSSVDEGEEGKVQLLYDLVYRDGAPRDQPTGVVVEAPRGGTLDVGMLHDSRHASRQRCTIEMWYHLPQAHVITDEIILMRRSLFYEESGDASKLCMPDEKHNTLWELAVLPTGLLELRTGAGSIVTSAMFIGDAGVEDDEDGLVTWEREGGGGGWNHVCLMISSHSYSSPTEFSASILMNGTMVVPNAELLVNPFGSEPDQDLNQEDIEDAMEKTVLIFGIGPSIGFRMTDIRVWAIQRSVEDVKMFMHESLRDAEIKKKFRVNIRKSRGKKSSSGGLLPPPPIRLPQPESKNGFALAPPPRPSPGKRQAPTAGVDATDATENNDTGFMSSFADFEAATTTHETEPMDGFQMVENSQTSNEFNATQSVNPPQKLTPVSNGATETNFVEEAEVAVIPGVSSKELEEVLEAPSAGKQEVQLDVMDHETEEGEIPAKSSFDVEFSDLLSKKVRASAAAAILRGPPAARHFGGNRGGLAFEHVNFGSKCDGVGPIAICGADKSVVWYSDRDPPGRTYPIGASGAVLSDIMDESQSEYMCCFLAKEKRMVVFELSRKTVIVELQMKTKLNFWRYLPPEAGGGLAFMLITPIGGFHWKPLDESPRPCQVWKRGSELESKKILAYEEGGCNGQTGEDAKSTVALVIASSSTPKSTTVEAYCIAMNNGSSILCVSNVTLGAALYCPVTPEMPPSYFLPFVITISKDVTSQLVLDIEDLMEESGTLVRGNIIASTVLNMGGSDLDYSYEPPAMSMGPLPEALCCCHDGFIVAVLRTKGAVFAYDFSSGELVLVGRSLLGQYVVDAAIRPTNKEGEAELVLLLCESDNPKDGRVATVNISRIDGVNSQYLSSV